jgi:hypothetical protein
MLTIRAEQYDLFSRTLEKRYKTSLIKRLRDKFPSETSQSDDDVLMAFINKGIVSAEKHDIIERRDISIYLEYMMTFGEDFDSNKEFDWAQKVFLVRNLSGEEKVKRLMKRKPL